MVYFDFSLGTIISPLCSYFSKCLIDNVIVLLFLLVLYSYSIATIKIDDAVHEKWNFPSTCTRTLSKGLVCHIPAPL